MGSIFVPDDHPALRLKQALDWEAIKAVMIKHWREAGKNVDGGPGLPWPTDFSVPFLVLLGLKAAGGIPDRARRRTAISRLDGRAVGTDSRSCIDPSSRSGAGRGGQRRSQCAAHRDRPAVELHRQQDALLGSDGSGTRPRGSERAWELERSGGSDPSSVQEAQAAGPESSASWNREREGTLHDRQGASSGCQDEPREEEGSSKDWQNKGRANRDDENGDQPRRPTLRSIPAEGWRQLEPTGGSRQRIDPADQTLDETGERGHRNDHSRRNHRSARDCQRQSEVRDEMVDPSLVGRRPLRSASRAASGRNQDAGRRLEGRSRTIRRGGDAREV